MQQSKHKLDIFSTLGNISKKNTSFYTKLSEDEQKALQPLVVMRWLSGTSDARQVYFLNELVNPFVFSLSKHKKLLVDLMAVSSSGQPKRYKWLKMVNNKKTKQSLIASVVSKYFGYNSADTLDILPLLSDDVIISYAEQLGYQHDEIKQLKKELKTR